MRYQENHVLQLEYSKSRYQENPVLQLEYNKRRYLENLEIQREYLKKRYHEQKKRCGKVENFILQVKQGPYYICIICRIVSSSEVI